MKKVCQKKKRERNVACMPFCKSFSSILFSQYIIIFYQHNTYIVYKFTWISLQLIHSNNFRFCLFFKTEASMYTPTTTTTISTPYTTSTHFRRTTSYRSTSTSWGGGGVSAASLSGYMFAMTVIGAFVEQYLQIWRTTCLLFIAIGITLSCDLQIETNLDYL